MADYTGQVNALHEMGHTFGLGQCDPRGSYPEPLISETQPCREPSGCYFVDELAHRLGRIDAPYAHARQLLSCTAV